MKKLLPLISLLFILSISTNIFSQWTSQYYNASGLMFRSIVMADENNGFVVGESSGGAGIIYKTTNGGEDFDLVLGSGHKLYSVCSPTSNIAIAVGANGRILKTTDTGDSWNEITSGTSRYLWSVYFIDSDIGWAAGGHYTFGNVILKTTDQGETWIEKPCIINTGLFNEIYFVNNEIGWAVGYDQDESIIVKTTNGGETWQALDSGVTDCWLHTVFFIDENIGFVAGVRDPNGQEKVVLLKTTDGGATWSSKISNEYGELFSLRMRDENNGWAVGYTGLHYETVDGGNTWINSTDLGNVSMLCLFFLNSSMGWGNSLTTVYKYQAPLANDEYHDNQGLIIQNCPNPFTTSTTIEYELKQPEKVTLTIYDYLGKQVYQRSEKQPQGNQQLQWDALGQADGLYFYKLKAGDQVANGKLIKSK